MRASLKEIVEHKKTEIERLKSESSTPKPVHQQLPNSFLRSLQKFGTRLIAEIKPASPSAGVLNANLDIPAVIKIYNRYATAISVLADEKFFGGSMQLLREVAETSPLPVLCKDFILDPIQITRAYQAGAAAGLLIVKILDDAELRKLHNTMQTLGMTPVVEVQTEEELKRALTVDPDVILINNRNLDTFEMDLETTKRLAPLVPQDVIAIGASGINSREDLQSLLPYCSKFLIGSALMQSTDMEATLKGLMTP